MMVHISDDGLSCQTQEGEEECHYNCIQGYFNRCWLLLLLKAEQFAAQILCSGGNGTHCYFLSLPTPVSSLQDFLYSLSSVLVWFIMLWAKITSFTFLHWGFSSKWNLPASFCFNGPLQKWQRRLVRLIGTIYALKEMTPFLWALSCVCVCVCAHLHLHNYNPNTFCQLQMNQYKFTWYVNTWFWSLLKSLRLQCAWNRSGEKERENGNKRDLWNQIFSSSNRLAW